LAASSAAVAVACALLAEGEALVFGHLALGFGIVGTLLGLSLVIRSALRLPLGLVPPLSQVLASALLIGTGYGLLAGLQMPEMGYTVIGAGVAGLLVRGGIALGGLIFSGSKPIENTPPPITWRWIGWILVFFAAVQIVNLLAVWALSLALG
jgi:hypothetical protein